MRKALLAAVLVAVTLPASPALAHRDNRYHNHNGNHRVYDSRGRYVEPRRLGRDDRVWRGRDGRYYCRRSDGTTGLIVGAAAGALLGDAIAPRGSRTIGALIGSALGGAIGHEVESGGLRCR